MKRGIAKTTGTMAGFKTIGYGKAAMEEVEAKLEILRTCMFSVLLYASETSTIKKRDQELLTLEMK